MANKTPSSANIIAILSNGWKTFWQRTNISGLNNASDANSKLRAKIWIAVFILFSLLTINAMYNVFHDYSLYPVVTSITVKYKNQVI